MSKNTIFLGDVALVRRGASPRPIGDPRWFSNSGPGWVRIADVTRSKGLLQDTEQCLSPAGVARSVPVSHGDLIMSICATVGEPVIVDMHACIHDGFVLFEDFNESFDTRFLYHFLHFNKQKLRSFGQTGTQANVNTNIVRQIKLPSISLESQRRIALILDTADAAIAKTEALIAKLKQMKAGLLHDLLTRGIDENGELRPAVDESLYERTRVGRIPKDWKVKELDDLVAPDRPICYGILMPGYGHHGGVPVIKVKDIKDGVVNTNDLLLTSPEIDAAFARSRTIPGDLLYTIRGTVGRMAFVPPTLPFANITQDTARIGVVGANPEFVQHYLSSPAPQTFVETHIVGVAVKGLNLRDVRRIPIALPPRPEQDLIVSVSANLDTRIIREVDGLLKMRQLKSGLMNDLLTGKTPVFAEAATAT